MHFLLHTDFEHVHRHGLVVDSKDGDFALTQVQAYRDVQEMPRCDVVAVALKATQNYLLPSLLPPVLADGGVVLLMQNGLGGEEDVARTASGHTVVAGLCFLCCNKVGPGHIRHLDYGAVHFAQYRSRWGTGRCYQRDARHRQGLRRRQPARSSWRRTWCWRAGEKLVWNVPMSGLSVVLNADTASTHGRRTHRALVEDIMARGGGGARASSGRHLDSSFVQKMLGMTLAMAPYRASMKIDFDEHRPMEVEAIYGNPVRAARNAGAAMPLVETLYRQLKFLDTRNLSDPMASALELGNPPAQ